MKHAHDANANVNVNIPKQDLEDLIDKVTDSAITIIAVWTISQIVKAAFTPRST